MIQIAESNFPSTVPVWQSPSSFSWSCADWTFMKWKKRFYWKFTQIRFLYLKLSEKQKYFILNIWPWRPEKKDTMRNEEYVLWDFWLRPKRVVFSKCGEGATFRTSTSLKWPLRPFIFHLIENLNGPICFHHYMNYFFYFMNDYCNNDNPRIMKDQL